MNSPAQFLPTDDWIISSAKLRTIVGVGGIPLSVNRLICEIRASSWTVVRRCLCVDEASRRETDWPFHRRRRVLSTRPNFLAVASIFGRSCDSKLAIAWSIGAVVVVLFMVEEGKVVRSNFLKFGRCQRFTGKSRTSSRLVKGLRSYKKISAAIAAFFFVFVLFI